MAANGVFVLAVGGVGSQWSGWRVYMFGRQRACMRGYVGVGAKFVRAERANARLADAGNMVVREGNVRAGVLITNEVCWFQGRARASGRSLCWGGGAVRLQ